MPKIELFKPFFYSCNKITKNLKVPPLLILSFSQILAIRGVVWTPKSLEIALNLQLQNVQILTNNVQILIFSFLILLLLFIPRFWSSDHSWTFHKKQHLCVDFFSNTDVISWNFFRARIKFELKPNNFKKQCSSSSFLLT